jgi:ribosome-interacting GTPase 1
MAYLDDIIIYLNSVEEHKEYIKWVLRKLYKKNMLVTVKKYKFYIRKTDFIEFIIKLGQISIDLKKIKAIINWQDPKSIIGLKLFLGFCNYYYRFIIK